MRIDWIFAALAFAVCTFSDSSQATASTQGVVPTRVVVAIFAFGPQAKLDSLEAFAKQSGFPTRQLDAPEGRELVIVFPLGTSERSIAAFVDRARSPEFMSLKFRFADAPAPK